MLLTEECSFGLTERGDRLRPAHGAGHPRGKLFICDDRIVLEANPVGRSNPAFVEDHVVLRVDRGGNVGGRDQVVATWLFSMTITCLEGDKDAVVPFW